MVGAQLEVAKKERQKNGKIHAFSKNLRIKFGHEIWAKKEKISDHWIE